jgi:hypothetical protein
VEARNKNEIKKNIFERIGVEKEKPFSVSNI